MTKYISMFFCSFFVLTILNPFFPIFNSQSTIFNGFLCSDTLIYWDPEQRLTFDTIPQLDCGVWAYDSFVHILVNYDYTPAVYMRSTDWGSNWSDTTWLSIVNSTGFKVLTQQDSVVYFAWSENRPGPPSAALVDTKYVFFRRSNDYGVTLDSAIFLGKGVEVSIDVIRDTIYVAISHFGYPPPPVGAYLFRSYDGGQNWSGHIPIIDSAGCPNIAYRNGILHYAGLRCYKIIYTRSTDLGNTWAAPTEITAPNTVLPKKPKLVLGPGNDIYISWTDNKFGAGMQFDDVMFRKSTDDGLTWGPEQRLTPDSKCQAAGALDMVSLDSMIFIVWDYNGIGMPAPCSLFLLASTDCGETWRPREGVAGGEGYALNDANIAAAQDFVYVVWRDPHHLIGSPPELYILRGSLVPPGIEEHRSAQIFDVEVFPNPFKQTTDIRLQMTDWRSQTTVNRFKIKIYDASGKEVRAYEVNRKSGGCTIDARNLPCGVYFVKLEAEGLSTVKKVIKIKQ